MFRSFLIPTLLLFSGSLLQASPESGSDLTSEKPNFIVIFTDDQGYGDVGVFGSTTIRTPHLDQLAEEGRTFKSFVNASSVCTPSRAGLLTGSYPKRIGMHRGVIFPQSEFGLHPEEHTIADHLKQQGYATACFGKWHLGHETELLPTAQGFDVYYGIPYSNDMHHPDNSGGSKGGVAGLDAMWVDPESTLTFWQTPLMENEVIIELPVDQRTITRRCTDRGIEFIKANQDRPFFLFLPYSMPHVPLYVPDDFYDPDPKRAYARTIEHLDDEVGRIFSLLRELELKENTYVIFTSDNGPWGFAHHGGSAGPLRGRKMTTFEGGHRVPFILWGHSSIPAGTETDALASTLDLLPTFAALSGSELPSDRVIDGLDITSLFTGSDAPVREDFLYYSLRGELEGIREGDWKLLVLSSEKKGQGEQSEHREILLFNLSEDIGEQNNLAETHPKRVEHLRRKMHEKDAVIEANARSRWTLNDRR